MTSSAKAVKVQTQDARLIEMQPEPRRNGKGTMLRYDILGYDEIPLERVQNNPRNPRPSYHLANDNPKVKEIADSIKTTGQHRPAIVYELVGHWSEADQPGTFRLLQGHRRRKGCEIAGVETLRCLVVPTPKTEAEEMTWLGVEDAHREKWSDSNYHEYMHAAALAEKYELPIRHPDVANMTGLSMADLKLAEKLNSLEPEIRAMVAEYEELMYQQRITGTRKKNARLSGLTGVRTHEFTPQKAALVWDIFEALRQHCTLSVRKYDDLELQHRIAAWSTKGGATVRDLEDFVGLVKSQGRTPEPGFLTSLDNLLQSTERGVRQMVRRHGHAEVKRAEKIEKKCQEMQNLIRPLLRNVSQVGQDIDRLKEIELQLYKADRAITELAEKLSRHIERLGKEQDVR